LRSEQQSMGFDPEASGEDRAIVAEKGDAEVSRRLAIGSAATTGKCEPK